MALDLTGLRSAIQTISDKLGDLSAAVDALQANRETRQDEIDQFKTDVENIGTTLDEIIADAKSGGDVPADGGTTPTEPTEPEA